MFFKKTDERTDRRTFYSRVDRNLQFGRQTRRGHRMKNARPIYAEDISLVYS